jgi:hypothetical protein
MTYMRLVLGTNRNTDVKKLSISSERDILGQSSEQAASNFETLCNSPAYRCLENKDIRSGIGGRLVKPVSAPRLKHFSFRFHILTAPSFDVTSSWYVPRILITYKYSIDNVYIGAEC